MSDIAELFARDPLKLTRTDIGAIVTYCRGVRAAFNQGDKSAGSTKKAKASKEVGPKLSALDLDALMNEVK